MCYRAVNRTNLRSEFVSNCRILSHFSVYFAGEDGMDDLPLAQRLKAQRAEKRKEKKRGGPQQEHSHMESGRRSKGMPYDHLKRNKV